MGTDKTNSQTAIIVATITVFGTLGASLFANWDKVFPSKEQSSSSKPAAETSVTSTTSEPPPSPETLPNGSSTSTDNFAGFWSSEEDSTAEYLVDIVLYSNASTLSGELKSFNQAGEDQSPLLFLDGEFDGDQGFVDIYDQNGAVVGQADLKVTNGTLVLNMLEAEGIVQETIPTQATLYPIDEAEF